jgi:hypothetical protein
MPELKGKKSSEKVLVKTVETGRFFNDESVSGINKVLLSSKSASSQGSSGTKFNIVCVGDLVAAQHTDVCLGVIGYGPTVCIRQNCQKNHLGGKSDLSNDNICVMKVNDISLFSEPTILREQVQTSLFTEWMGDKATLEEWAERFEIVASSKEVINEDALKDLADLKEMARNFNSTQGFTGT